MKTFKDFLKSIPHKFKPAEEQLLEKSFNCAKKAHQGQKRKSGEDYFVHCIHSATILGQIFPDCKTLCATLLHDVPEDTQVTVEELKNEFGEEIALLVDGVTKLGHVRYKNSTDKVYVDNLRKLFIATSQDVRVILIKLSDRLHNMRTIEHIPAEKQLKVATETLEVYAPIAGRLGINSWKDELEDLSFKIVSPEEFEKTKNLLDGWLANFDDSGKDMEKELNQILHIEGIKYQEVTGRTKRLYSLNKKLAKYDGDINKIYDIVAFRIITKSTADCYAALGVIHKHFQPLPGRIKDYISIPKPNGYQSLHTTVFSRKRIPVEIQIRTDLMNEEAERGVAAHWFYAEEGKPDTLGRLQSEWIKELNSWQEESENSDFMESLKIDFFRDRIFVFTPKGDIKNLPLGASVIDFAFAVHTDIASHMIGCKINGKIARIYDTLNKGDVVEITKNKQPVKISRDWLEAAHTSSARAKIKHMLKLQNKGLVDRIKELRNISLPTFFRKS